MLSHKDRFYSVQCIYSISGRNRTCTFTVSSG